MVEIANRISSGISIIVCCYNSATRLPETLKHLALQNVSREITWEIIIVDNNSIDDTPIYASTLWNGFQCKVPFKIVREERQGLSFARNRGMLEAQYELLIFCDDDNWLDSNYVQKAYSLMNVNKRIGVLGGRSEGIYEKERPDWFDGFGQAYAIGRQAKESGIINTRTYVAGAGMIVRRSALQMLEDLSFKQLISDRKGNDLISGGDAEICLLVMFLGYDLYYDEQLRLCHFMPANRLGWKYCVNMITKGHAIPQLYFFFYNYCYEVLAKKKPVLFDTAYKIILRRTLNRTIRHFKGIRGASESFRLLIISKHGSKKEIQLKSEFNKLRYLLFNKKKIRQQFQEIALLVPQLIQIRTNHCHAASIKNLS